MNIIKKIWDQTSGRFIFSSIFFLVCMSLDFSITNFYVQDNIDLEGNILNKLWLKMTGQFHYIDIPIWIICILGIAFFFKWWGPTKKHEIITLWWLNSIAFQNLLGFLSWLPYGILNFVYYNCKTDYAVTLTLSGIGITLGLLLALIQIIIKQKPVL